MEDYAEYMAFKVDSSRRLLKKGRELNARLERKVRRGQATPSECGLYRLEKAANKKALRKRERASKKTEPRRSMRNKRSYGHMRLRKMNLN